jgi:hypothetical protein
MNRIGCRSRSIGAPSNSPPCALALVLLWIYYSNQIFLFGAEFTRAWADIMHGRGPDTASDEPPPEKDTRRPPDTRIVASAAVSHRAELHSLKSKLDKTVANSNCRSDNS